MIDYHVISVINHYMGVVHCRRCNQKMEVLRGVVIPLSSLKNKSKVHIPRTSLFAEIQCPNCKSLVIFRKIV